MELNTMNTAKKLSIRLEAVGGDKVRQEFNNLGNDGTKAFQRITQVITPANDNLKALDATARGLNNVLKQAAGLAGAYLGFRGLTGVFKSIVGVNKEFEQLFGSLKTVTGSAAEAKKAFAMIEEFATSTPYQLEEIVEAFIRLKAMGLEPSQDALTAYGNSASAFGKNILDFVGAVAGATVGEFERLKQFGIKAKVEGESVSFIFQGVTTKIGKNAAEIEAYLRNLGKVQFAGAMSEQMKTIGGITSNIADNFSKLARDIGKNGLNTAIKDVLAQFNSMIGSASNAAKTIGETLATAVSLAGNGLIFLGKNIDVVTTLLICRLGSTVVLSGITALRGAFTYLNTALLSVVASGRSAILGIAMMSNVSRLAALQMGATALAAGVLRGALALIGGPAGLAVLAGVALYKLVDSHDFAKRAASDHAETLQGLKDVLKNTTQEVNILNETVRNEALANWAKKLKDAEKNIKDLEKSLHETGGISVWQRFKPDTFKQDWEIMADDLQKMLSSSKINLEQYQEQIWELAKDYPDFTPMANKIQEQILLLKAAKIDAQKARDELNNIHNPKPIAADLLVTPKVNEQELAKIRELISTLNNENVARMRLIAAKKQGDEAVAAVLVQNELEAQVRRLNIALTKEQTDEIKKLITQKVALDKAEKQSEEALRKEAEASKKYHENLRDIQTRLLELKTPYEKAVSLADEWRENALNGLDEAKSGYQDFKNEVEAIYADMVKKAQKAALDSSTAWNDGITRGLQGVYADMSDTAKMTEGLIKNSFKAMEDTLVDFVMTGKMNFADFANSVVSEMVRMAMQYAVIKPLMGGMMGYFGIPMAHTGGVIGADNLSSRAIDTSVFANAPRFHGGGLVGGEIPIIAQRGETVFTPGQMKALGSEMGAKTPILVNVNVINKAEGTKARTNTTQDASGNLTLDVIVEQIESSIGKNISKGEGLSPILEQRYALNPAYGSYR